MTRTEDYDRIAASLEQQLQKSTPLVHWQVERSEVHLVEYREFPDAEFKVFKIFARMRINGVGLTADIVIDRHSWKKDVSGAAAYIALLMTHKMVKRIMEWGQL